MENESFAMELLRDAGKRNKRTFTLLLVVILLWFMTIGSFVWYINQFDYVTESSQEMNDIENSTTTQKIGD